MTDFPPFSQLLSRATVQTLQMRCLTFSSVNWLRNGESSKVGEYIWRTLYFFTVICTVSALYSRLRADFYKVLLLQGRNMVLITGGARYLFILTTSKAYVVVIHLFLVPL